ASRESMAADGTTARLRGSTRFARIRERLADALCLDRRAGPIKLARQHAGVCAADPTDRRPVPGGIRTPVRAPRPPAGDDRPDQRLAPGEDWAPERLARDYGNAHVVAAMLDNGKLLDDAQSGVVFRQVALREVVASLGGSTPATHYVMAPTWDFPPAFARD